MDSNVSKRLRISPRHSLHSPEGCRISDAVCPATPQADSELTALRLRVRDLEASASLAPSAATRSLLSLGGAPGSPGAAPPASRGELLGFDESLLASTGTRRSGADALASTGAGRAGALPAADAEDPGEGAGLVEVDTAVEVERHKIIKWLPNTNTVTLEGHTDGVMSLGHSALHKKLFSGSMDRTVRVWDIATHDPLCDGELKGHRGGVTSMAVGGHRLVTGSMDHSLKMWDVATLKEQAKFSGHVGMVHGIMLLNDMCFSVSQDKSIKIWDLRQRDCVTTMDTRSRGCYGFALHELKLLSASGSKIVTWDLRMVAASTMNEQQREQFGRYDTLTGNCAGTYGHQMVGDRLYTSAVDNSVRLWDLRSLQVRRRARGRRPTPRSARETNDRFGVCGW